MAETTTLIQPQGTVSTTTSSSSSSTEQPSSSDPVPNPQQPDPPTEQPKKAKRKRITTEQLEHLVGLFEKTDTPSFEIREGLAKKLGMSNREIQVWFQNRRAKANRVKINEQAALHHQQHLQHQQLQQQQQQQHLQQQQHQHHHQQQQQQQHLQNHRNGYQGHVHSAPATPLQPTTLHQGGQDSSFGYFGSGSSSPPMVMPTPTPRNHSNLSQHPSGRRPASLYNIGSYGHGLQSQQFQQPMPPLPQQQKPMPFQQPPGHYPPNSAAFGNLGMDIPPSSTAQRPGMLPPPITTVLHRMNGDEYDSRRPLRHERTLSEGHPAGYLSPPASSPVSMQDRTRPPGSHPSQDDYPEDTATMDSKHFTNGDSTRSSQPLSHSGFANNYRHSNSSAATPSEGPEEREAILDHTMVSPRERPSSGVYYIQQKNRRSVDDAAMYDEQQQLMRDNFNMDTRLVISEDEPRPESAIDILAYAAACIQESEEHKKDGDEKRDSLGRLGSTPQRQSFHATTGYSSRNSYAGEVSSRHSGSWEAAHSRDGSVETAPVNTVATPRGNGEGQYAPVRRPRPMTYGGSGYLYDHHENQFMPQSPSSSLAGYGRSGSSSSSRRPSARNSTEVGYQRGLTRPRRSSSTTVSAMMNHHLPSSMSVLPPIMSEGRLLSPAMVASPAFGVSRSARQDSLGRDSPVSDVVSRDSFGRSDMDMHGERDAMDDVEDEEAEINRLRAAKRRSGNANSFFACSPNGDSLGFGGIRSLDESTKPFPGMSRSSSSPNSSPLHEPRRDSGQDQVMESAPSPPHRSWNYNRWSVHDQPVKEEPAEYPEAHYPPKRSSQEDMEIRLSHVDLQREHHDELHESTPSEYPPVPTKSPPTPPPRPMLVQPPREPEKKKKSWRPWL